MKHLYVLDKINFPLAAVTQKFAWIGRSGSGKTYGAGKFAEELLENNLQTVIIDSVGCWYGLRMDKKGKPRGYSIPIFGGEHGDVPLLPTSGKFIAKLIVEKRIHAILDVSVMRKKDMNLFLSDFAEEFLHLKKSNKSPVHLFLEEAQKYIPQNLPKGQEKIIGDMEDICKVGRNYGIGISILSQRPQAVHKDCLNQTEVLLAFQVNAKHDRKAIEDWVEEHCDGDVTHVEQLSRLEIGQCFLWSPQWLKVLDKVKVLPKKTADTSQTPSIELKKLVKSKKLAPVALAKIKKEMEVITKEKKENDPAELKKRIWELEKQVKQAGKSQGPAPMGVPSMSKDTRKIQIENARQQNVLSDLKNKLAEAEHKNREYEKKLTMVRGHIKIMQDLSAQGLSKLSDMGKMIGIAIPKFKKRPIEHSHTSGDVEVAPKKTQKQEKAVGLRVPTTILPDSSSENLGKCERSILIALAQMGKPCSKNKTAILSRYAVSGGGFNNSLGKLRRLGFIKDIHGDNLEITQAGHNALGEYNALPTGEELHEYWLKELSKCESAVLKVLLDHYPNEVDKAELASEAGYDVAGGGFNNALGRLRTLELVQGKKELKASEELFV